MFHHAPVLVLALGIGIGIGQYYWVLGAFFGIVLTLLLPHRCKLHIRWFHHVTNADVISHTGQEDLPVYISVNIVHVHCPLTTEGGTVSSCTMVGC